MNQLLATLLGEANGLALGERLLRVNLHSGVCLDETGAQALLLEDLLLVRYAEADLPDGDESGGGAGLDQLLLLLDGDTVEPVDGIDGDETDGGALLLDDSQAVDGDLASLDELHGDGAAAVELGEADIEGGQSLAEPNLEGLDYSGADLGQNDLAELPDGYPLGCQGLNADGDEVELVEGGLLEHQRHGGRPNGVGEAVDGAEEDLGLLGGQGLGALHDDDGLVHGGLDALQGLRELRRRIGRVGVEALFREVSMDDLGYLPLDCEVATYHDSRVQGLLRLLDPCQAVLSIFKGPLLDVLCQTAAGKNGRGP